MASIESTQSEWVALPDRARQTLRDLFYFRPFHSVHTPMPPMLFKATSSVFIPSKLTSQLIASRLFRERFQSTKRLYQYLNWTMRISKSTQNMKVMEGQNGRKVLLFDVELHDERGQNLFALCTPNVTQTLKAQPWRLLSLVTAHTITKWTNIDSRVLPRGVRAVSPHFEQYRNMKGNLRAIKREILEIDTKHSGTRYCHLRCIRAKHSTNSTEKVLTVKFPVFYELVHNALKDENVSLVPIVSIVSKRSMDSDDNLLDFSVDYILPVQIKGNWVAVVYRDGKCILTLMDRYDITNKAVQCDPSFNIESMDWFTNNCNRLRIVPDVPRKMRKSKKRKSETMPSNQHTPHSVQTTSSSPDCTVNAGSTTTMSFLSNQPINAQSHIHSAGTSSPVTPRSYYDNSPSATCSVSSNSPMTPMSALAANTTQSQYVKYVNGNSGVVFRRQESGYIIPTATTNVKSVRGNQTQQMCGPQVPVNPVVSPRRIYIPQIPDKVTRKWIQWTDRTIQMAVAEAHYFVKFHPQYIAR